MAQPWKVAASEDGSPQVVSPQGDRVSVEMLVGWVCEENAAVVAECLRRRYPQAFGSHAVVLSTILPEVLEWLLAESQLRHPLIALVTGVPCRVEAGSELADFLEERVPAWSALWENVEIAGGKGDG